MKPVRALFAAATAASLLALGAITGCTIDSASEFYRDVPVNFSGFYQNPDSSRIVAKNSGKPIVTLDLRQSGDSLQAIDNNGRIWRGTLGEVQGGQSSFNLTGTTTEGVEGTFSGTLKSSGGGSSDTNGTTSAANATGSMEGTYVESDLFSPFRAEATIADTGGGTDTPVSISPTTANVSLNGSATFNASGGTAPYSWTLSPSQGSITAQGDSSALYTRGSATGTGTVITVTATDFNGRKGTASVVFQ